MQFSALVTMLAPSHVFRTAPSQNDAPGAAHPDGPAVPEGVEEAPATFAEEGLDALTIALAGPPAVAIEDKPAVIALLPALAVVAMLAFGTFLVDPAELWLDEPSVPALLFESPVAC